MRIKLGEAIHVCTKCSHPIYSNLLILTTSNGVYTVDMIINANANIAVQQVLTQGWCDFSDYHYSN